MAVSIAGITVSSVTLFIITWTEFGAERKGLALLEQMSTKTQAELTLLPRAQVMLPGKLNLIQKHKYIHKQTSQEIGYDIRYICFLVIVQSAGYQVIASQIQGQYRVVQMIPLMLCFHVMYAKILAYGGESGVL